MFNEITAFGWGNGLTGTEVLDGGDWQKALPGQNSTILELGGNVFESHIEAYRDYLNSLKSVSGKSIWTPEGAVTSATQIA